MKKLLIGLSALVVLLISGCGNQIQQTAQPKEALESTHIAGIGDVILHIDKKSNLKNAFGKADVFGRTTDNGYSELRFAGIDKNANRIFYRKDIDILTNETTMSRTKIAQTYGHADTNLYGNNASTNYSSTTYMPSSDYHKAIPSDTIQIKLSKNENKLYFLGHVVHIIEATSHSLKYKITK